MSDGPSAGNPPGTRTRAWLARLCGDDTMARVVDPCLADFQHEARTIGPRTRRHRWIGLRVRWAVALGSALCLDLVLRTRRDDGRASSLRPFVWAVLGCGAVVLLQLAAVMTRVPPGAVVYLLPSTLVSGLPVGALLGAMSVPRRMTGRPSGGVWAGAVLTVVASCVTAGVLWWAVPSANQAYRVRVWATWARGAGDVARPAPGPNEMSMTELRNTVLRYRGTGMPAPAIAYQIAAHKRLSIPVGCLVFGWLGTVLASTRTARTTVRRVVTVAVVVFAYYVLITWGSRRAEGLLLSPALAVWLPNIIFALSATCLMPWNSLTGRSRQATPSP